MLKLPSSSSLGGSSRPTFEKDSIASLRSGTASSVDSRNMLDCLCAQSNLTGCEASIGAAAIVGAPAASDVAGQFEILGGGWSLEWSFS